MPKETVTEGHSKLLWTRPAEDPHSHMWPFLATLAACTVIVSFSIIWTSPAHLHVLFG